MIAVYVNGELHVITINGILFLCQENQCPMGEQCCQNQSAVANQQEKEDEVSLLCMKHAQQLYNLLVYKLTNPLNGNLLKHKLQFSSVKVLHYASPIL